MRKAILNPATLALLVTAAAAAPLLPQRTTTDTPNGKTADLPEVVHPGPPIWEVVEPLKHAPVVLDDATADEILTSVFVELSEGRTKTALELLEYVATGDDAERDAWVAREKTRIAAWVEARDAFVATLPGSKTKLRVQGAEKAVNARVDRLEDGVLYFKKNSAGVKELAVEGSDPRVFGAAMAKADLGWVAVLPGLWTGDKKAARALEGDGADIAALRADQAARYPALLAAAAPMRAFIELARGSKDPGWPATLADMDALRGTIAQHATTDLFASRLEQIEHWAAVRYRSLYSATPAEDLFRAEVTRLDGDRVQLRYDFSDPDQVLDFVDCEYLGLLDKMGNKMPFPSELDPVFETEEGILRLIGDHARVHRATLGAPFSYEYQVSVEYSPDGTGPFDIVGGICTGPDGRGIWSRGHYGFLVYYEAGSQVRQQPLEEFTFADVFTVRASHEEGEIVAQTDDAALEPVRAPKARAGRFVIRTHSYLPATFGELTIEATYGEAEHAVTAAREARAATQRFMESMGVEPKTDGAAAGRQ
ncbi:MAG: hypothetical protein AAFZ87_01545 [Planctomycetota bacterium]